MATKFQDNAGRLWIVGLDVDALKRVRTLCAINLLEVLDDDCKLLAQLHDDPITLCDVLFAICKPQADHDGVSDEDFGRGMYGDAINGATEVLLKEMLDFFPKTKREPLRQLIGKLEAMATALTGLAAAKIEQIDVDSTVAKLINSFGGSPDSSASTLAP